MPGTQIGAQMYTIREHTKTPADIAKSCRRLREIGYRAVQVSALGEIDTEQLARILRDEGLACAATHVSLDQMQDVSACVDYHKTLGCEYAAVGGFGNVGSKPADWRKHIETYNRIAPKLAEQGIRIGYHNHSHELAPLDDKPGNKTPLHLMEEEFDPSVWFEIDTYWIVHGGADPIAWIDRIAQRGKGRLDCVHFKDMTITPDREQKMCEVGSGNLNWPGLIDACRRADVKWYLVERDRGDLDPFESLKISLENMNRMGLT